MGIMYRELDEREDPRRYWLVGLGHDLREHRSPRRGHGLPWVSLSNGAKFGVRFG